MSGAPAGPRIELELHPALSAAVRRVGDAGFASEIADRVSAVMAGYGIPGRASAAVSTKPGLRAACVFVDGRVTPYPPSFLRRLWFAIAPPELHAIAFDGDGDGEREGDGVQRYPDTWLVRHAARAAGGDAGDALGELLLRLVEEVAGLRPSGLLTAAAAGVADEQDPLLLTGRALVDRAVKLPAIDALDRLFRAHAEAGRSPADTLEDLYAVLRAPALELHLHPDVFERLAGSAGEERVPADDAGLDPELAGAMAAIRDYRLLELGVRMPVLLVRSGDVRPDEFRVKLNDRLGPPVPIPGPDEVGVSVPVAALAASGVAARPLVDAVTGHELAAVRREDAQPLEALGLLPALPGAYVAGAFARSVTPHAFRLLSTHEVEADVAALEETFPSVVHGALSRYSLTAITVVLRELVREQVSIRDLWTVLNAMLRFAELRPEERAGLRLGTPGAVTPDGLGPACDGQLVAYVRRELRDRVAYDSGAVGRIGPVQMGVYVTEAGFDERVAECADIDGTARDAELTGLRNDVWHALGASPPPEPVLVCDARARRPLREALVLELPGARVLAREEIPPEVELHCLGVVTPDGRVRA